jgi:hypothetical protein
MKRSTKSSSWQQSGAAGRQAVKKKERDKNGEMLHNLASLLMNTTLHRNAEQAVPNKFFNN